MITQLQIPVVNVSDLLGLGYTCVEVWLTKDDGNTYNEITATAVTSAALLSSPARTTFQMAGRLLKLAIDGESEVSITFDITIANWTPTQVRDRINQIVASLASLSNDGLSIILTSPSTGRTSSLLITYNDADSLGFEQGDSNYGRDERIALINTQIFYLYSDNSGLSTYRYKWRFSADGIPPFSDFSNPVFGSIPPAMGADDIAYATAVFVNGEGRPVQREVIVVDEQLPNVISNFVVGDNRPRTYLPDANGFIAIPMVIGSKVRVALEGTALVRSFEVPNVTVFNLLAALTDVADPFTVQSTTPQLVRRSL